MSEYEKNLLSLKQEFVRTEFQREAAADMISMLTKRLHERSDKASFNEIERIAASINHYRREKSLLNKLCYYIDECITLEGGGMRDV